MNSKEMWITWVKENIEKLVSLMVNNGIDEKQARDFVKDSIILEPPQEAPKIDISKNFIKLCDGEVRIISIIKSPFICYLEDVLTTRQCDELIKMSFSKVEQSKVYNEKGEADLWDFRTSSSTHFDRSQSEFIKQIDDRLCELINYNPADTEVMQIIRYQNGQEYKPHKDYFKDNVLKDGKKNRFATLIVYLTDVEEGGTTSFPKVGATFCPKKGSALYFEYSNSKGDLDDRTLHSGDPVINGEKWILSKWFKQV